jgi:hypothetical protein
MPFRVHDAQDSYDIAIDDKHDAIRKTLWKSPAHLQALVTHHVQQWIFRNASNGFTYFADEIFGQFR